MANTKLLDILEDGLTVIGDGAMGTWLQANGLKAGDSPEEWNVTRPDTIHAAHRAYFEAGSQVATANTFGGTRARLQHNGLQERVAELNTAAVAVARAEADAVDGLVGGDVGPTGELIEPYGLLTLDEAIGLYTEIWLP